MKSKNFNKKGHFIIWAILVAGFCFLPFVVEAATTIYFDIEKSSDSEQQKIYENDTFLVDLKISSADESVNVIDGTFLYDSNKLEIKEISIGGSLFTLWTKPPTFSNEQGILSFVGGVPAGFQGINGQVLKIVFLAKSAGKAEIDFLDGVLVFLNDGHGTSISPWLRPFVLDILERPAEISVKDEWEQLVEQDETPPEFIEAVIGRAPHIFDNQYFVSFFAVDAGSGVAYYEIREGGLDVVRAESPYLLQEQSLQSVIQVKVVDQAGNERTITTRSPLTSGMLYKKYFIWMLEALLGLALVFVLWRLIKAKLR